MCHDSKQELADVCREACVKSYGNMTSMSFIVQKSLEKHATPEQTYDHSSIMNHSMLLGHTDETSNQFLKKFLKW